MSIEVKSFSSYITEQANTMYFTFGRMNPPTIGHGVLLDKIKKLSGPNPYRVYLSHSEDKKKNPLSYKNKIKYARKIFPKHARNIILDNTGKLKTMFMIADTLYKEGFTSIAMVVGSDRVREFDILLNKYNGEKRKDGFYKFEVIKVLSAGQRDPDAEGAAGMSASKMRKAAAENDFISFNNGIPDSLSNDETRELLNLIRKGMGLKESIEFRNHLEMKKVSDVREKYVSGDLYQVGDRVEVKETNELGTITKCGTNYLIILQDNGESTTKWLHDVNEASCDSKEKRKVPLSQYTKEGKKNGSVSGLSKAYGKGLAKSTNKKRRAQFNKQAKMDDDDPRAYKPAPGDAEAETKPSKHTKKFKQMFGEDNLDEDTKKTLQDKAKKSGMPYSILKKVFDRGVAAWKSGHRPGTTAVQWGFARVNSFATKSKGTWGKADKDLADKVRGG